MSIEYNDVNKTGLARQIADKIRAAIMDDRLKAGERLPTEGELAQRFGVSRPTVREALKRLAAQNLIRSQRGPSGGTFVRKPDVGGLSSAITGAATLLVVVGGVDIDEVFEARRETESVCCRFACSRRTELDIEAMSAEIAIQSDASISDIDFCASDVRFHRALVQAAGNSPLALMMYTVVEASVPITNMIVYRVRERRTVAGYHQEILDAIVARDSAAAIQSLTRLLDYLRDSYAASVDARTARLAASTGSA